MALENESQEVDETASEQNEEQAPKTWKIVENDSVSEHVTKLYKTQSEEESSTEQETSETEETTEESETEQKAAEKLESANEDVKIIDNDTVKAFLKNEYGIEADNLEDLKPKEAKKLSAVTEAFQKYVDETNNDSIEDFVALQKDWSKEPKENVLKALIKAEKPYLDDSDIDLLLQDKYGIDELDEFATESEKRANRLKEISFKDDYQKGLALLESQKEKYKIVRGSDELVPQEYKTAKELVDSWNKQQEESKITQEKSTADFLAKTDSVFTKDFDGFKVKVGEQEFKIKPENTEVAKSTLSDLSNFDKKFFDQTTGELKDPNGYYKALHFAMNPDKVAEHFINIGKSIQAEQEEKDSKNIQTTSARSVDTGLESGVKKWKVVD